MRNTQTYQIVSSIAFYYKQKENYDHNGSSLQVDLEI